MKILIRLGIAFLLAICAPVHDRVAAQPYPPICNVMAPRCAWKFPCGFCGRPVKKNEAGVFCDVCCLWNHCRCFSISASEYRVLQSTEGGWCCPSCERLALPFADCSLNSTTEAVSSFSSIYHEPKPPSPFQDAASRCLSTTVCSNWSLPSPQHSSKPALSSLSLLFSNCRSLMHQMDELQVLVANASPPTIIALAETWLDNTILPCSVVDVWNGIPEDAVSSSQTVRSFKAKLRELLFT